MALIYIVEDDKAIQELEAYALRGNGYDVVCFDSSKKFYSELNKKLCDLAIIDIMLPGEDGITITKNIRNDVKFRNISIVMVTAKTSELDAVKGLDCGADDYITKPFSVMIFLSRIKAVLRRRVTGEDVRESYTYKDITLDDQKHKVYSNGVETELTYKEYQILKYLLINEGLAVTREQLLDKVWGYDSESESRTVDSHMLTLRKKLGENGKLIHTIRNVGFKLGE